MCHIPILCKLIFLVCTILQLLKRHLQPLKKAFEREAGRSGSEEVLVFMRAEVLDCFFVQAFLSPKKPRTVVHVRALAGLS